MSYFIFAASNMILFPAIRVTLSPPCLLPEGAIFELSRYYFDPSSSTITLMQTRFPVFIAQPNNPFAPSSLPLQSQSPRRGPINFPQRNMIYGPPSPSRPSFTPSVQVGLPGYQALPAGGVWRILA